IDPTRADPGRPAGIFTSALAGHGIAELQGCIHQRLVPRAPVADQAVLFLVGQIRLIEQVAAALDSERWAMAGDMLADFNRACGPNC
ncbi:MAG TPA: hypothetical protein VHV08_10795, partial [Pirellulales bacterium]|nr:hypothetical protein [Pirellulales bacterium]